MQVHARSGDAQLGLTPAAAPAALRLQPTRQELPANPERAGALDHQKGGLTADGCGRQDALHSRVSADAALMFRAAQGAGLPADVVARAIKRFRLHVEL